ncbi:MAG: FmdE family protein [Anaerolineales bacterium]
MELSAILEKSSSWHSHLCPRQVLGARIGLTGLKALGFGEPPAKKRLLVIVESDGCFADGIIAATDCTVGHRTLRVEDYGKIAAAFVDTQTGRTVRIAPRLDIRDRAYAYAPDEKRHYFAQLHGYQVMPDDELLTVQEVALTTPLEAILSRPGVRVNCASCGEEIINEREIWRDGQPYCHTCVQPGYYRPAQAAEMAVGQAFRSVP